MRTYEKVRGAPVFFANNENQAGYIADIVFSFKEAKIAGYWVHTKRWWSKRRFLSLNRAVHEPGGAVSAESEACLERAPKECSRFSDGKKRIFGTLLLNEAGSVIGLIEDVYYLPETGKIVGYELTEGLFADLQKGIKVIKPKIPVEIKGRTFIVRTDL